MVTNCHGSSMAAIHSAVLGFIALSPASLTWPVQPGTKLRDPKEWFPRVPLTRMDEP